MSWFKRDQALHIRLAREAGLEIDDRPPHDPGPRWGEVGIHGIARPREWDAVVNAEAPQLGVGQLEFVTLPDGTLVVDDDVQGELEPGALDPLAAALESQLAPPYRAEAVWRGGSRWGVAARRIEVAELPAEVEGDEITLSVAGGERSLTVDGQAARGRIPSLERLGAARGEAFVVRAERLAGQAWEVDISLL